jgi:hypothetical protein
MSAQARPRDDERNTERNRQHPQPPRRKPQHHVDPVFELEPFPFGD